MLKKLDCHSVNSENMTTLVDSRNVKLAMVELVRGKTGACPGKSLLNNIKSESSFKGL